MVTHVAASAAVGPPTAYAGSPPFANIEYDVAHTSTPLQAIAGGGTDESDASGVYIASTTQRVSERSRLYIHWTIKMSEQEHKLV